MRREPNYLVLKSGRRSTATILNPELVVEVLSGSTQGYDLGQKLETYKQVASLRQVLFVNQYQPRLTPYVRSETPGVRLNTSTTARTDTINVLGFDVVAARIYKKIKFGADD